MKEVVPFLKRLLIFFIAVISMISLIIYVSNERIQKQEFTNDNCESNLFFIKTNAHYDLLFLGISHARNVSRHTHHEYLEKHSGCSVINLAQGGNLGGLQNQFIYLQYFYEKNNTADKVVVFLSPSLMFNPKYDLASNSLELEPFHFDFCRLYWELSGENKKTQLFRYGISKLLPAWWTYKPITPVVNSRFLTAIDSMAIQQGIEQSYSEGLHVPYFIERKMWVEKMIDLAKSRNSRLLFVFPPALFGQWPGHDMCREYILQLKKHGGIAEYDFSESIKDPQYYYDHHHLNTPGMHILIDSLLLPILIEDK